MQINMQTIAPTLGLTLLALIAGLTGCASGSATAPGRTITGAAILDHPCGKVSVEHMGLTHAGKVEEAVALGTPDLQQEWRELPSQERATIVDLMRTMSRSSDAHAADIAAHGRLAVAGDSATLTITKSLRDASGSSSETFTQRFLLDQSRCAITQ
jgi:hypothetical protein